MATAGVAVVALWRTFQRESTEDQDKRIKEVIKLELGEDLAVLNANVKRIMRKLDINGEDE